MNGNLNQPSKKKRSERATLELNPGPWRRLLDTLQRGDVLLRLWLCALAAAAIIVGTLAWRPPFAYREGQVLARDLTARVTFEVIDEEKTELNRDQAQQNAPFVYRLNPQPLEQLQQRLTNIVARLAAAETLEAFGEDSWKPFELDGEAQLPLEERQKRFAQFKSVLAGMGQLDLFNKAVTDVLSTYRQNGLLQKLATLGPGQDGAPTDIEGSQSQIQVYLPPAANPSPAADAAPSTAAPSAADSPAGPASPATTDAVPDEPRLVSVDAVLVSNIIKDGGPLKDALTKNPDTQAVADRVFHWLKAGLADISTLSLDEPRTRDAQVAAAESVAPVPLKFVSGQRIAAAGVPISTAEFTLLLAEHQAAVADPLVGQNAAVRVLAVLSFLGGMFALCGFFAWLRQRSILDSARRLAVVLILFSAAVIGARWVNLWGLRLEVMPLLSFSLILAVAYKRETAWVLGTAAIIVFTALAGLSAAEFIVLEGVQTVAVLQTGRIRSRARLIRVSGTAALAALGLVLSLGILDGPPLHWNLLWEACLLAVWTFTCGFLITGLLPFIERLFGVLTDLSLLELGDASHPLLQELVRRAPGTYNHSINVASLGEAAADSIGAHGLLVRVGAYFHDIGKMLKPHYFTENQDRDDNRHESLVPAMSTLIIIAHVKDGADLARQHRLPDAVVDFIEQHHGTTLVEYFFQRASEREKTDDAAAKVEESAFRYPGPKPQTREAAVLMLADAVESATRSLTEPTSARIEALVESIAMKKLMDGQFDECPITLQEIRQVQDSLVKSLIAVYHGRVKYPSQRTA